MSEDLGGCLGRCWLEGYVFGTCLDMLATRGRTAGARWRHDGPKMGHESGKMGHDSGKMGHFELNFGASGAVLGAFFEDFRRWVGKRKTF